MNAKKKFEQYLRDAPKPSAPDDLLEKLQADISTQNIKMKKPLLQRWFLPAGHISPVRIAVTVAIAILFLMPLTYGASKFVKVYNVRIESKKVHDDGMVTLTQIETKIAGNFANEEEATEEVKRIYREISELQAAGKYEKIFKREEEIDGKKINVYTYRFTLSDGKVKEFSIALPEGQEDIRILGPSTDF